MQSRADFDALLGLGDEPDFKNIELYEYKRPAAFDSDEDDLPTSFDWRENERVTRVKNQVPSFS
jgi:C1A family cysteine protease